MLNAAKHVLNISNDKSPQERAFIVIWEMTY